MLFIFGFTPIVLAAAKGKKKQLIIALKFKSKHIYMWYSVSVFLAVNQFLRTYSVR